MLGLKTPSMPTVNGMSTNRKVEWLAALNLLAGGFLFALPGYTLEARPVYKPMLDAGWTDASMAALFTAVGVSWCMALYANGHWRRSPFFRCLGALAGTVIWGQIAGLHIVDSVSTGVSSLGVATYSILAGFCLAACFRAAADLAIVRARRADH